MNGSVGRLDDGRYGNPTVRVLEERLAFLEGAQDAVAFSSGMNAPVTTILTLVRSGSHARVQGGPRHGKTNVVVKTVYEPDHDALRLEIQNVGDRLDNLRIANGYTGEHTVHLLAAGDTLTRRYVLDRSFGWYDLTLTVDSDRGFQQRFGGHLETGKESASDPALGGV